MITLTLQETAAFAGATLATPAHAGMVIDAVSTDTRRLVHGSLFVALKGENHDAHQFLPQAVAAGAAALLVEQSARDAAVATGAAVLVVNDTLVGLQNLAHGLRRHLNPLVVGVTGSNGKTSTKEFLRAVLASRYNTAATPGNLNNHVGVPLTLLGLTKGQDALVCEMGMNHPGEIAPLARIAEPGIAVITNIGLAHIEFMGTQEAIALEKGELVAALSPDGLAVLNADDPFTDSIAARCRGRVLRAGLNTGEVRALNPRMTPQGMEFQLSAGDQSATATIPVLGLHMVANATLAAAVGWSLGIDLEAIASALASSQPEKGRLQLRHLSGLTILDDSYNANPDSMRAGILTLIQMNHQFGTGRRIAVLGHMAELGAGTDAIHGELGRWIADQPVDTLCTVGAIARPLAEAARRQRPGDWVQAADTHAEAAAFLQQHARPSDVVLLKGSRSAHVETVLDHLPESATSSPGILSSSQ